MLKVLLPVYIGSIGLAWCLGTSIEVEVLLIGLITYVAITVYVEATHNRVAVVTKEDLLKRLKDMNQDRYL